MRELVVVSGKGGTGKTSIVASFFALAEHAAVADCDVDAADLHLVLGPTVRQRWPFSGGRTAVIDSGALHRLRRVRRALPLRRHPASCTTGRAPPTRSIRSPARAAASASTSARRRPPPWSSSTSGEWFVSDTRHGPMVHARLGIAQENSGKLVSLVRREAKAVAVAKQRELLICDGSPGIGCPVIASIAGARMVLIVTEPTLSGLHDLQRVAELCRQFNVKTGICINKADINPEVVGPDRGRGRDAGHPRAGAHPLRRIGDRRPR